MNKDKVMALIRKKHEETGVSINTLLLLFFFEHFLERVSSSCYKTDLVLKGGFLLSSMLGIRTRTTMDIDMALQNRTLNESELREVFDELVENSNDEICYEIKSVEEIKIMDEYPGYKVSLIGRLENIQVPFSIDIATGDPITPEAIEYKYRSIFDDTIDIDVLAYNIETIIAEKLETLVSRKTDNSRSKDFYDLYIIFLLKTAAIKKDRLQEAVIRTFEYRGTDHSTETILNDLEDIQKDAGFKTRWNTYCERNDYVEAMPFEEMIDKLKDAVRLYFA